MDRRLFWPVAGIAILAVAVHVALRAWSATGAAAVALLLAMGAAALLAWRLTRSIQRARALAGGISRGEFSRRLPETQGGAVGDLYRALNRLSEEVGNRIAATEAEEAETETLLREMGEGVLALSPEGSVARANAALRRAIGCTESVEGQSVTTLFRNPALIEFLSADRVPAQGEEGEFDVFDRTMLVSARRLPAGGVVAVFSDLTHLRRLQRIRTEFVANASHELKTPLTAVRGYAETLLDDSVSAEDRRNFAGRIVSHADRMSAIVDDLLTLARLEEPGYRVHHETIPVRPVVEGVWEGFSGRSRIHDIEFSLDVDADLEVGGDPEGLRQVLENLLDNAVRHSGAETAGVRAAKVGADAIEITVWDTGQGIPSSHLERIFERFYRVDPSRSRASGGTGLGLSIVKHWVESMGGRVWAESRVGEGTEVHVVLAAGGAEARSGHGSPIASSEDGAS